MAWLEGKTDRQRQGFAENFNANFENIIDAGDTVSGGKRIEKPKGYFKAHYKAWLPAFE
jgi:hypothetical protein